MKRSVRALALRVQQRNAPPPEPLGDLVGARARLFDALGIAQFPDDPLPPVRRRRRPRVDPDDGPRAQLLNRLNVLAWSRAHPIVPPQPKPPVAKVEPEPVVLADERPVQHGCCGNGERAQCCVGLPIAGEWYRGRVI